MGLLQCSLMSPVLVGIGSCRRQHGSLGWESFPAVKELLLLSRLSERLKALSCSSTGFQIHCFFIILDLFTFFTIRGKKINFGVNYCKSLPKSV